MQQPTLKRRRFKDQSEDASHSTLVEVKEPVVVNNEEDDNNIQEEQVESSELLKTKGLSRRQRKTLKKQEKREKRMKLLEKIQKIKEQDEQNNPNNKQKQQKSLEDGQFMFDIKESVNEILQKDKQKNKLKEQEKIKTTKKQKQQEMINEIQQFNLVANHPVFQQNPMASIQQHLKNKMKFLKQQESTTPTIVNNKTSIPTAINNNNMNVDNKKPRRKARVKKRSDESLNNTSNSGELGKRNRMSDDN
ncbi:hypothetical protein ABK040_002543 [Willaertia magna]